MDENWGFFGNNVPSLLCILLFFRETFNFSWYLYKSHNKIFFSPVENLKTLFYLSQDVEITE